MFFGWINQCSAEHIYCEWFLIPQMDTTNIGRFWHGSVALIPESDWDSVVHNTIHPCLLQRWYLSFGQWSLSQMQHCQQQICHDNFTHTPTSSVMLSPAPLLSDITLSPIPVLYCHPSSCDWYTKRCNPRTSACSTLSPILHCCLPAPWSNITVCHRHFTFLTIISPSSPVSSWTLCPNSKFQIRTFW
jgi:hypothetical protein